jgi:hypothetical protein
MQRRQGRRELRIVTRRNHREDAADGPGSITAKGFDLGVRMRATEEGDVLHAGYMHVFHITATTRD